MDDWPEIKVRRFRGEKPRDYAERSAEIIGITNGFRHLRFEGDEAELMEARLLELKGYVPKRQGLVVVGFERPKRVRQTGRPGPRCDALSRGSLHFLTVV